MQAGNISQTRPKSTYNRRLELALKVLVRAKQAAGARKVKQRPKFVQRILNRRAGDHEAVRGADLANLLRQLNARILDAVALVEDDVVPAAGAAAAKPTATNNANAAPTDTAATVAAYGSVQPLGARRDETVRGQQHAAALPNDVECVIACARRCAVEAANAHRRTAPLGELTLPAGQHWRGERFVNAIENGREKTDIE